MSVQTNLEILIVFFMILIDYSRKSFGWNTAKKYTFLSFPGDESETFLECETIVRFYGGLKQ